MWRGPVEWLKFLLSPNLWLQNHMVVTKEVSLFLQMKFSHAFYFRMKVVILPTESTR